MISFTVRMKFAPEDREDVAEVLRLLTEASRQEPGCISYIPHRIEGDPDAVLIYEQYKDAAAADAHRHSPHSRSMRCAGFIRRCLSAAARIWWR